MIVGIGELLWDTFPDGRKVAGGAPFNFAFHCQQLGHEAAIVSRVGDDELGRELREEVKRLGMTDEFIQTDFEHPTGTVRVAVDDGGQPSYEIVTDVAWDNLSSSPDLDSLATRASAMCFGSLAQRAATTRHTIRRCVDLARQSNQLLVCDINIRKPFVEREILLWCQEHCDWLKMSEDDHPTHRNYFANYLWENSMPIIIFTCGAAGALLVGVTADCRDPNYSFIVPAVPTTVVDTVGAGDAFTAAMVCLHLEGRPLQECARFANCYAARVCEFQGGTPRIDRRDVERTASSAGNRQTSQARPKRATGL